MAKSIGIVAIHDRAEKKQAKKRGLFARLFSKKEEKEWDGYIVYDDEVSDSVLRSRQTRKSDVKKLRGSL